MLRRRSLYSLPLYSLILRIMPHLLLSTSMRLKHLPLSFLKWQSISSLLLASFGEDDQYCDFHCRSWSIIVILEACPMQFKNSRNSYTNDFFTSLARYNPTTNNIEFKWWFTLQNIQKNEFVFICVVCHVECHCIGEQFIILHQYCVCPKHVKQSSCEKII